MRAAFLEAHTEFEGVGAHEFNRRYDPVDEGEHDASVIATPETLPALFAARSFLSSVTVPVRLDGPDVSHWQYDQEPIRWAQVAAAPTWWAATKLTQSIKYLDPTAVRSRTSMFAAGHTHRGLYHWLSSTTDPEQQAAWFLSKLGLLAFGEFVMLDDEEGGVTVAATLAWVEAVEKVTRRPVAVYTGAYVAGGTIWQSTAIREGKYGPRPMILAAYTTEAKARALPGVAAYPWSSWQYSSNGPVPGVTGRCDMNRVDDRAVYDLAAGLHPLTPAPAPPPEDDMPAIVTNSDAYDDADGHHEPNSTKWEYLGGERIHISLEYWNGLGAPEGNPRPYAEIMAVPAPAQPVELTSELIEAPPMHFTGTIDLRAAG